MPVYHAPLGGTRAVGGFEVPDRIAGFPALIGELRRQVHHGGGVVTRGTVRQIHVHGRRVTGVGLASGGFPVGCSLCVLAGGAWSAAVLRESGIDPPDLILRKCVVLDYDGELPGLTTCLYAGGRDGAGQDVTLAPFRGRTLAAGAGFTEVAAPDDTRPDHAEAERLRDQLARCFPALRSRPSRIVTCVKTEKRPALEPDVSPEVYGPQFHGITGLLVAIPGKASFMFDLADRVLSEIGGQE